MLKINYIMNEKFGKKIKIERIKRDLQQKQLADLAGISRDTIGSIERGKVSPTIDSIEKIANALNIEAYKLFIFDDLKI